MAPALESSAPPHPSSIGVDRNLPTTHRDVPDNAAVAMPRLALAGLTLCLIGLWLLQHPYGGLLQDSVLYAMGAFARLHPGSLGHDLYLNAGSQDHYTIFSPLVAGVIHLVGIAHAAALVTAISQAALYLAGWTLARRLMPATLAILAVALLVLLPSLFGSQHIFWYTEDIMTPRVPAEALVLAGLACALGRRYIAAALCFSGAMLLHPLMGVAGLVMLYMLLVGLRHPWLTAGLGFAGIAALGLIAFRMPFGRIARFDPAWFGVLHERLQYLFPSLWSLRDWGRMSVALATVVAGASMREPSTARSISRAALATWVCGIAIALVGSDLLHIIVITQAQTWRWLWLTNATAVLLFPLIALDCLRSGTIGRATLLLLVASWVSVEQMFVAIVSILAIVVAVMRHRSGNGPRDRRVLAAAWAFLALALVFFFGFLMIGFLHQPAAESGMTFFQSVFWTTAFRIKPWTAVGIVPAAIFAAIWWTTTQSGDRGSGARVVVIGVALCCVLAPYAWFSWSDPAPSEQLRARFAPWRRAIPDNAQVLAPGVPIVPWFLLERSSYWTTRQMAGVVYSKPLLVEFLRREHLIHHFPPAATAAEVLTGMCRSDREIGFIVTPVDMGPSPFAALTLGSGSDVESLHLYRCADHLQTVRSVPNPAHSE